MVRRALHIPYALLALCLATLLVGTTPDAANQPGRGAYERFAVAADHALASEAGVELLRSGGNAADAAAATMLALGVVNPQSSGMGGGGFALYYDASERTLTFLDFRERAPMTARSDMFEANEPRDGPASRPSQLGGLATGVPGEPAGIAELVRRFGGKPLSDVAAPAARLAAEGFPVGSALAEASEGFAGHMKRDRVMRSWFEGEADALREGQTLRQPELARTLRAFGERGASAIFSGAGATAIVRANREQGGQMTLEDLAAYRVVEREPLSAELLGYRWVTAPPPSAGGYTMLASLSILDRVVPGARRREGGAALMHAFAESWKGPFWDRASYFGDPDHVEVPIAALLDPARIERRAQIFRRQVATAPALYALPLPGREREPVRVPDGSGTSHLCTVDAEGNVAAVTTTVNLPFGARYTAAGMVMNDEMDDFASAVGEANAFGLPGGAPNLPGPGHRPVSTMSPTIVLDEDGPLLCVGAAGGSRIVTATQQVAWHALVRGLDAYDALTEARVHHQGSPNALQTEETNRQTPAVLDALAARGHAMETRSHSAVVQLIRIQRDGTPRLVAVSDPRKGGAPAGE
jgi:gamma-glutamyltranspeptidase/glutathione hydrolase